MVVLVFLYMVGAIFIIGAEFNAALLKFEVLGHKVLVVDLPPSKPDQSTDVG
jgi:membrane protein